MRVLLRWLYVAIMMFGAASVVGGCVRTRELQTPSEAAYVVRVEAVDSPPPLPEAARYSLLLNGSGPPHVFVRFSWFTSLSAAAAVRGDVFRTVGHVIGPWRDQASVALFAEWQVADTALIRGFEESRLKLFQLRAEHIESFHADWLLQSVGDASRFLVLGLYGTEEGAQAARGHPAIREFAEANPAAAFSASDSGVRGFRVAETKGYLEERRGL